MACTVHEAYSLNMFYAQKHGLVEAGKRGSRQHSVHRGGEESAPLASWDGGGSVGGSG